MGGPNGPKICGRRTKTDFKDRALGVEYDIGSGLEMLIDEGKQEVADKNLAEADVEELDVVQKVCVSDESSASIEPYDEDAVKKVRTMEAMGIINIKEKRQIPSISLLKKVWCRINLKMRWLNWMMGRW